MRAYFAFYFFCIRFRRQRCKFGVHFLAPFRRRKLVIRTRHFDISFIITP